MTFAQRAYPSLKAWMLSVLLVSLMGCKDLGLSNNSGPTPTERPDANFSGVAFDAPLRDAQLAVYHLDGNLVASGTTDSQGEWSLTLPELVKGLYRIEASGGSYIEEYSGKTVSLGKGQRLIAYTYYVEGDEIRVPLTYYTTIAAAKTDYLLSLGADPEDAMRQADTEITDILGMDSKAVIPVDITDQANAQAYLTVAKQYGFFTAGLSSLTAWISERNDAEHHRLHTSIQLINLAYDDILHNGQLDGQGIDGPLSMGTYPLTTDLYRNDLARHILAMVNHPHNAVGTPIEDMLYHASRFNDHSGGLFGDEATKPLGNEAPITHAMWSEDDIMTGEIELRVMAIDLMGIQSVTLAIHDSEGQPYHDPLYAEDTTNPIFTLDTHTLPDGIHTATITATSWADGVTVLEHPLLIANEGLTITSISPEDGEHIRGHYTFAAHVNDPVGIEEVTFWYGDNQDTQQIPRDPDGEATKPWLTVDTTDDTSYLPLRDGEHTFTIEATGWTGYTTTESRRFIVDNTPPTIALDNIKQGDIFGDWIDMQLTATDAYAVERVTIKLDGQTLHHFNDSDDNYNGQLLNYAIDTEPYTEGYYTLVVEAKDLAGNIGQTSREIFIDRDPPEVEIESHYDGQLINKDTVKLTWSKFDSGGFPEGDHVKIFLNNVEEGNLNGTSHTLDSNSRYS